MRPRFHACRRLSTQLGTKLLAPDFKAQLLVTEGGDDQPARWSESVPLLIYIVIYSVSVILFFGLRRPALSCSYT